MEIKDMGENLKIEKEVSDRILMFLKKRTKIIEEVSDKRDKLRDTKVNKLMDDRTVI